MTTMSIYEARTRLFPRLRRFGVTGIVRNGSCRQVRDCCICGSTHSMAVNWPMPRHMREWIAEHEETCGAELLRRVEGKVEKVTS